MLVKYYIKVVPEKGFDVQLDKENIKLNVDGETGIVSWDSTPSINLPSGAELVYDFCSIDKKNNWHFAGSRRTDYKNFESFNMYDDVKWYFPGNVIKGRVLLNIYFSYEDIRWSITQTEQFEIKDMF